MLKIENAAAEARIAEQGAHITHYRRHGEAPLIWLSEEARFAPGKSLRGGVPICWPWFGAHDSNPALPAHGYARTQPWRLLAVRELGADRTRVEFELEENARSRGMWPHSVRLRYAVTIGEALELELESLNTGTEAVTIGAALHSYFLVGDVGATRVDGLSGRDYLDKVDGFARKRQNGAVGFHGETDRIYLDTPHRSEIVDPQLGRRIVIDSRGSASTVVWNPGPMVAARMGDLGPEGWRRMLCVETANAAADQITLAPGAAHTLAVRYTTAAY